MLKICITGHRDLLNMQDVSRDIAYSFRYFAKRDSDLVAVSAVAAGADLIFAEQAYQQNIPLQIVLPFDKDEYSKDFSGQDLERFNRITQLNSFTVQHQQPIQNEAERKQAYLRTGQQMVDEADIVVAVWDKKPSHGKGGTADIVNYALTKGKELHIINAIRIPKPGEPPHPAGPQEIFTTLDKEAILYKKIKFERAWIAGIVCGLLAVLSFAISQVAHFSHTITFLLSVSETSFLFLSFVLLAGRAKKWKNLFLSKRRSAEYLRTVLFYKEAGIPIPAIDTDSTNYKPEADILAIEKDATAAVVTIHNMADAKRVAWCLAQNQIDYHQQVRIEPFHERLENTEKWLKGIKYLFFGTAITSFLLELMEYKEWYENPTVKPYLLFLALILPPVYAAIEGIKYFGEWKRNISVSKKIVAQLEKSKERILQANSAGAIMNETKELRHILEIENYDWAERYDEKDVDPKP